MALAPGSVWSAALALTLIVAAQERGDVGSTRAALFDAAWRGDATAVRALLRSGLDPNCRDAEKRTPLMAAARGGHSQAVRALIVLKADVDASTPAGSTALMEAAKEGHADVVRALLEAGADPDARHRELGTALDIALAAGHDLVADALRSRGARGSGRSPGESVCVRVWAGQGFCGRVVALDGADVVLDVTGIVGCAEGCGPDRSCSAGRPVGGSAEGRVATGARIRVPASCLTHTGVATAP
jgi:hypothetical protein